MSEGELHVERLLGRRVLAGNGRSIGRIEEIRAEWHGAGATLTEYVIGPAGLAERLSASLLPFLATRRGYVARWDQIEITGQDHPRLRCPVEELQRSPR